MNIIINGLGGQHDLDVSSSFIQGYESVGGVWTGSILMTTDSLSSSLSYAKANNYKMVIRSTSGMESYISTTLANYPDVLTVMPAGTNSYTLIYSGSIPQNILICGAGDVNNETGYHIEFFAPDPIQIEPDASSYSNGYIAGQIAYIMDSVPCGHWEARYRSQQTAIPGTSGSFYDGYGLIDINAAINYTGSIIADPFVTGSYIGSGNIPLGGYTMQYLTPITISSSLNVIGPIRIGLSGTNNANNLHNITGSIYINAAFVKITDNSTANMGLVIENTNSDSFLESATIILRADPTQSNQLEIINTGQNFLLPNLQNKGLIVRTSGEIGIGNATNWTIPFIFNINNYSFNISGSLNVSGSSFFNEMTASNILANTITADAFTVNTFTTASTDVISGSTKFGSVMTDIHQFTGSLRILGNMLLSGSLTMGGANPDISGVRNMTMTATNMAAGPLIYLKGYGFNAEIGNGIKMFRSRGTPSSGSILFYYDSVGSIVFAVPSSSDFPNLAIETAKIESYRSIDDSPGSDLRFFTTYDGGQDGPGMTERMIITERGNVGINTSVPEQQLHVNGTTKLGGSVNTVHQITGSVNITGSLSVNGVKVYKAVISQNGTSSPVATVLQNTLESEVSWSRDGVGLYRAISFGTFNPTRTLAFIQHQTLNGLSPTEIRMFEIGRTDSPNSLWVWQKRLVSGSTAPEFVDGFTWASVLIEVYPIPPE